MTMAGYRTSRWLCVVGLLALALLPGCQALVSDEIDLSGVDPTRSACKDAAGAYSLPRHLLSFAVTKRESSPEVAASYAIEDITTLVSADPRRIYCLDFLSSATATDKIAIARDGLLLTRIASSFSDQTIEIANKIVDAAAQSIAAASGLRGAFITNDSKNYIVAQFDFDPFSHEEMIKVNRALAPLDHCVFLDPVNDPYVPAWQVNLCTGYRQVGGDYPYYGLPVISPVLPTTSVAESGILYRPLLTHKLVIMKRNHDPGGTPWQLFQTQRISMTNAAPTFVLEVKRSAFVERKMSIAFNGGVLDTVSIVKPSEADAFARFALRTAQVIVSIPVRALVIGQTDAKNRQALINAQAALIQTLRQYGRDVDDFAARTEVTETEETRSSRAANDVDNRVAECMRTGALIPGDPLTYCTNLVAAEGGGALPDQ